MARKRLTNKAKRKIKEFVPDPTSIPDNQVNDEAHTVAEKLALEGLGFPEDMETTKRLVKYSLLARRRRGGEGTFTRTGGEASRASPIPPQEEAPQESDSPAPTSDQQSKANVEQISNNNQD